MHFDARPGLVNRNVQAADIRETAAGVRWYEPVMAPLTNHMEDAVVIRNLAVSSGHSAGHGLLWYGEGQEASARDATPWANYLSSSLLADHKVPASTLLTYLTNDDAIRDYVTLNNVSPDPLGAAQRVQKISDFSNGLDVLQGQPTPEFQGSVFDHVTAMDSRLYSRTVQGKMTGDFEAGNSQANELLTQPLPVIWPPDQATQNSFGLSGNDVNRTVGQGNQMFRAHLALAFQMARLQLSHAMFIQSTQGGYDTHNNHDQGQRNRSTNYMPAIADLLDALKATESPVRPGTGASMFDTTHVVIMSELSRANRVDNGDGNDGLGTPHWPWTQALMFGGSFKRGYVFGDLDADLKGVPTDFATGALNQGQVPNIKNLHATILQANGVNPAGWTESAPITAVLEG